MTARPFLKWAGGKRSLLEEIGRFVPGSGRCWIEPFLGGGAAFFAFGNRFESALLLDANKWLVDTWRAVRDVPESLAARLGEHERAHARSRRGEDSDLLLEPAETHYLRVRNRGKVGDPVEDAAMFIYLNKTCFNGLWRVNKSGRFNVPEGDYANPLICDGDGLREASAALRNASIKHGDFGAAAKPEEGDFVYCDPPYFGTYRGYTSEGFSDADQVRLRDKAEEWRSKGAKVLLSNSDAPEARELYAGWEIKTVEAPGSVGAAADSRKRRSELLIWGG